LRELGRALAELEGYPRDSTMPLERLVVPISIPLTGDPERPVMSSDVMDLVDALRQHLDEGLTAMRAWRPGAVYCFQSASCDAPQCTPPDDADTFSGYTASGKPEWTSFVNLCIDRKDPRVDKLFDPHPEVIALAMDTEVITSAQLPVFGKDSHAFRVLGQVAVGLLPRRLGRAQTSPQDRIALTLQIIETRSEEGRPRLRLNIIGMSLDEIAAAAGETGPRGPAESLRRTINETRRAMVTLEARIERSGHGDDPAKVAALVRPLLSQLRGDIARCFRSGRHRTQHAEKRHTDGKRPTSFAMGDAENATDEHILGDARRNTIVVLGPRSRAHVFSKEGRHVTSLRLDPGELERKMNQSRWQSITAEEIQTFRSTLAPNEDAAAPANEELAS